MPAPHLLKGPNSVVWYFSSVYCMVCATSHWKFTVTTTCHSPPTIRRGGRIGRAQASHGEGQEFESWPSQTNDTCRYLARRSTLGSLATVGQGLVNSVQGYWGWLGNLATVSATWSPCTIKSPWVCTVKTLYTPWYDLNCCQDVNL